MEEGGREILCRWKQSSLIYRMAYILRVLRSRDSIPPLPPPRDPRVHGRGNTIGSRSQKPPSIQPLFEVFSPKIDSTEFPSPPFLRLQEEEVPFESRLEDATVELLSRRGWLISSLAWFIEFLPFFFYFCFCFVLCIGEIDDGIKQ